MSINKFQKIKLPNEETNVPSLVSTQLRTSKIYRVKPQFLTYPATFTLDMNQKKCQNFFQSEEDLLQKLNPSDRGPKLDGKGNIIKHTLVGSVQMFLKEHQNRTKSKPQVKIRVEQAGQESTEKSNIMKQQTNSVLETATTSNKLRKHLNKQYKETPMTLDEVRNYIEKCQQRVKNNTFSGEKKEKEVAKNLLKGEKLYLSASKRIFQKFEDTQEMWEDEIIKSTEMVNRQMKESIMVKIDDFRNKKEIRQLLEQINYKSTWQQSLRAQSAFNAGQKRQLAELNDYDKGIEIIRKPHGDVQKFPFQSFTSKEAYIKKLQEHQAKVKRLVACNDKNLLGIEIEGKNKLKEEIRAVTLGETKKNQEEIFHLRESHMETKHSAPFIHRVLRDEENLDLQFKTEIIEANYNKKELLKRGKYQVAQLGSIC